MVCIFVLKIITVAFADTKYMICNTPTTPSGPIIHALQVLAKYMPQYHKSILLRSKTDIFVRAKFASPSEFECDSNALIFSPIGHELNELHQFYKIYPEMEVVHPVLSVLQTAVRIYGKFPIITRTINDMLLCLFIDVSLITIDTPIKYL